MFRGRDQNAESLYASSVHGDARALEALLQAYLPRLRAFVRLRLGAQFRARESDSDVVQSVCRELLQHRDTFRYENETKFRGWLFTAAANKVREKLRFHHQPKRSVEREREPGSKTPRFLARSSAGPSYAALAAERVEMLEAAMDRISDSDREVITLARLAELSMDEVAARLGKNEMAARKQLGRALLRLSAELNRGKAFRGSE